MPETDPSISPRCPRCDSDALIPDAFFYAEGYGAAKLSVGVYKKPDAVMMKGPVRTDLKLSVCGDCGHVEAEAGDFRALWAAYVERLSREFGK